MYSTRVSNASFPPLGPYPSIPGSARARVRKFRPQNLSGFDLPSGSLKEGQKEGGGEKGDDASNPTYVRAGNMWGRPLFPNEMPPVKRMIMATVVDEHAARIIHRRRRVL